MDDVNGFVLQQDIVQSHQCTTHVIDSGIAASRKNSRLSLKQSLGNRWSMHYSTD